MNIRSLDLNLLVVLDAMLAERHVTRAAKRVGLSQPAMSNALARLRDALGDPLFVRSPDGMQPTPRAEALALPLAAALAQLDNALGATAAFVPKTAELTFNLATFDFEQLVLLPALLETLSREAPGIRLSVTVPRERLPIADLQQGRIDLMIGIAPPEPRPGLYQQPLFEDSYTCLLRPKHPDAKKLTLERYCALEHLLISPFGGLAGPVDAALANLGKTRIVKVAFPHFALAPFLLLRSDCVLTLPSRAGALFAATLDLVQRPPPVNLPKFRETLFWSERTHADPAHRWLRSLIKKLLS